MILYRGRFGRREYGALTHYRVGLKPCCYLFLFPETSHHCQLSAEGICRKKEKLLCQEEEKSGHKKRLFLC